MGLDEVVVNLLETNFSGAFSNQLHLEDGERDPGVIIVDYMQWVKSIPKEITMKMSLMQHFVGYVRRLAQENPHAHTIILVVDLKPLDPKRAVAHAKRHDKSTMYTSEGGPYLPRREQDTVPSADVWIRFASNYKLLQRELYPALFNAFVSCRYWTPRPGQRLILSGFPGRSEWVDIHSDAPWSLPRNAQHQVRVVHMWDPVTELPLTAAMEEADSDLYHRAFVVEHVAPSAEFPQGKLVSYEWEELKSDISEADTRIFWLSHYFNHEHVIFSINDRDAFPIGLLNAAERVSAIVPEPRHFVFTNRHTVRLPVLRKKKRPGEVEIPQYTFVNLNKLYELVHEYPIFKRNNVQNPILTLVFIITLNGTDFFDKFLFRMGYLDIIWGVFISNIVVFTHLVQASEGTRPNTRIRRPIVLDEDRFALFIRYCFIAFHEVGVKRSKKRVTVSNVRTHTRTLDETRQHWLDANTTRAFSRAILWVMQYWKWCPLGYTPDCFEMWRDLPYYPYWRNPANGGAPEFITLVSPYSKPIDDVFLQNMRRTQVELVASNAEQEHKRQRLGNVLK